MFISDLQTMVQDRKLTMKPLIVGNNSSLGKGLASLFQLHKIPFWTSTRHMKDVSDSSVFLELSDPDIGGFCSWIREKQIDTAFYCVRDASVSQGRDNQVENTRINVQQPMTIFRWLTENRIKIIYPSTNAVFDGSVAFTPLDAVWSPKTTYGKQKTELEKDLIALSGHHAIVRFSKILTAPFLLFETWKARMQNAKIIRPFSDMVFSPISVNFAVETLYRIAVCSVSGIWHVSNLKDISYSSAAEYIAEKLQYPSHLVVPQKTEESGIDIEHVPLNTTLDINRIKTELNLCPSPVHRVLDWALGMQQGDLS